MLKQVLLLLSIFVISDEFPIYKVSGKHVHAVVYHNRGGLKDIKINLKDIPCKVVVGDWLSLEEDDKGNRVIKCLPQSEGC